MIQHNVAILLIAILISVQDPSEPNSEGPPGFVQALDFNVIPLEKLSKELNLTDDQRESLEDLKQLYYEERKRMRAIPREELDEDLRGLKRRDLVLALEARIDRRFIEEYYHELTNEQRQKANRFVLQMNMREGSFAAFLRRPWVKENLKITEEMLPSEGRFRDSEITKKSIAELDQRLRQEVISVLPAKDRKQFLPYFPETVSAKPARGTGRWVKEFMAWWEFVFLMQTQVVRISDMLELSSSQRQQLNDVKRELTVAYNQELHLQFREKVDGKPLTPEKLREISSQINELLATKFGREAGTRIDEILLPFQADELSFLLLADSLAGEKFYHTAFQKRLLEFLNIDPRQSDPLKEAAEKALSKRELELAKIESETRLAMIASLPKEQQQLFEKFLGIHLK